MSACNSRDSNKSGGSVGIPSSAPRCQVGFWPLALLGALQGNVDMKDRIPLGVQASIWLWSTHLQVKELAVPPVDSLGGGVGPGHVDNVYLQEKEEWVSG